MGSLRTTRASLRLDSRGASRLLDKGPFMFPGPHPCTAGSICAAEPALHRGTEPILLRDSGEALMLENHRGREDECAAILRDFFAGRRDK